ncbi:MAG: hypothetical protein EU529_00335 [Promethearchaeota archaeon]|nr:MAG: hypothetical protein EU529_00335 [Candidatus Lokiarchaeota archaeon]
MSNLYSPSSIKCFFSELYKIIGDTDKAVSEIWFEISEIKILEQLDKYELSEFLDNFEFIEKKRGNYMDYISIDKIKFVAEAIKYLEIDIKNLSELLDFNGFEALVQEILLRNDYRAIKNFRFTDKSDFKSKTGQKKYEIDVIGVYRNFFLIIDAKQWRRKDSFSQINKAANLQLQRVIALKKNPEIFTQLIHKLLGLNPRIRSYLPLKLIPIIVSIEDNGIKINDKQVPLVSITNFNAFLNEFQNYLHYYKVVEIKKVNIQKQLV